MNSQILSLFTNIPLTETVNYIINKLFPKEDSLYEGFNKDQFRSLLKVATQTSNFFFNGVFCEQIDGVAMGTPCQPTLAHAFLCHYKDIWLYECPICF